MEKGLHGEVKRTHGKGIYKKIRGNKTEWGEGIYTKTERRPHALIFTFVTS